MQNSQLPAKIPVKANVMQCVPVVVHMTANPRVPETVTVPAKDYVKGSAKVKAVLRLINQINPLKKQVATAPVVQAVVLVLVKGIVYQVATSPAPVCAKETVRV